MRDTTSALESVYRKACGGCSRQNKIGRLFIQIHALHNMTKGNSLSNILIIWTVSRMRSEG